MPDSLALDPRDRGGLQQPMLIARDLRKHFPVKGSGGKSVQAVDGVSFVVDKGETLGIVGESGCGKSTLARLLLHLIRPDAGELVFDGDPVGFSGGIAVDALRHLGTNATADQIHDYVEGLHGFAGIQGVYDFRNGDQRGLGDAANALFRWDAVKNDFVLAARGK